EHPLGTWRLTTHPRGRTHVRHDHPSRGLRRSPERPPGPPPVRIIPASGGRPPLARGPPGRGRPVRPAPSPGVGGGMGRGPTNRRPTVDARDNRPVAPTVHPGRLTWHR